MNKREAVAFTQEYAEIKNVLTTKLKISSKYSNMPNGGKNVVEAQWDTGASMTAISKKLVEMMDLPVVSMTNVGTAAGVFPTTIHIIDLELPNGDVISNLQVVSANLNGAPLLIGMDVISRGDFAISNFDGKTILNFRIPSYASINFVQMAKNSQPISKSKKTNRNDPCPCGSGKKYKNCCGKDA